MCVCVCVCITESLCYIEELDIVNQLYFNKIKIYVYFLYILYIYYIYRVSLLAQMVKNPPAMLEMPEGFHGQRSLAGPWGHKELDTTE